jgi:hypothetical protein
VPEEMAAESARTIEDQDNWRERREPSSSLQTAAAWVRDLSFDYRVDQADVDASLRDIALAFGDFTACAQRGHDVDFGPLISFSICCVESAIERPTGRVVMATSNSD